jgi:prefoldin subunit 5
VVDANRGLMKALGKASVSMTKSARSDLDKRIRKLDVSRQNARKQLDVLTKRLMALAKGTKARPKAKARRR